MGTEMDRAYCEWPQHGEVSDQTDCQEASISQLLDHGSISFGRFAVESLSWEKWSVFSHNRCKEELEKFKAPGLVAQKKAYFEEYYKKIRALKALQSQQDAERKDSSGEESICSQTTKNEQSAPRENDFSSEQGDLDLQAENTVEVSSEPRDIPDDSHHIQQLETKAAEPYSHSPRNFIDGEIEEVEDHKDDSLHEERITDSHFGSPKLDSCVQNAGETGQLKECDCLGDEIIKMEDSSATSTVQCDSLAKDVMCIDLDIVQVNNPRPAKVYLDIQINGSSASSPQMDAASEECMPQSLKKVEAASIKTRMKAGMMKADTAKSLQALKDPHCKAVKKVENGTGSSKRINGSMTTVRKSALLHSHQQPLKEEPFKKGARTETTKKPIGEPFKKGARTETTKKPIGTKSSQRLQGGLPEATSKAKKDMGSAFGSANAMRSARRSTTSISLHGQNAEIFTSHRARREVPSLSSVRPSKEPRSGITVPRPFSFSTDGRIGSRAGGGNDAHVSDRSVKTSVNTKSLNNSSAQSRLMKPPINSKSVSLAQSSSTEINVADRLKSTLQGRRSISHSPAKAHQSRAVNLDVSRNNKGEGKREAHLPRSFKFTASPEPNIRSTRMPEPVSRKTVPWRSLDLTQSGRKRL